MESKCPHCSNTFTKSHGKQIFCSNRCAHTSNYIKNREQKLEYGRNYRKTRNYNVKRHQKIRLNALKIVGNGTVKCSRCGADNPRLLEINHIEGGGHKEIGMHISSYHWFMSIIEGKRQTNDLNILCKVCNAADFLEKKHGARFEIRCINTGNVNL